MSLASEAAYLYIRSKEFTKVNKELKRLGEKAQELSKKHANSSDEKQRKKYHEKHSKTTEEIKKLVKRHNQILTRIKHHMVGYNDALRKQHRL